MCDQKRSSPSWQTRSSTSTTTRISTSTNSSSSAAVWCPCTWGQGVLGEGQRVQHNRAVRQQLWRRSAKVVPFPLITRSMGISRGEWNSLQYYLRLKRVVQLWLRGACFQCTRARTPKAAAVVLLWLVYYVGLARTIYLRCAYNIFGRYSTKCTVIYGVYIRFWPTGIYIPYLS